MYNRSALQDVIGIKAERNDVAYPIEALSDGLYINEAWIVFSENFARELYAHIILLGRSDNMEQGVIMIEFVSYHLATLDCSLK